MLQIFTYSTGLAFTGRSAACAPATATRPAAEPRRRLFTIFIVTSKFAYRGRDPLVRCRNTLEGPLQFPAKPPCPLFLITAMRTSGPGRCDLGMPPSVALATLMMRSAHTTKKPASHRVRRCFSAVCCTNNTRNWSFRRAMKRSERRQGQLIFISKVCGTPKVPAALGRVTASTNRFPKTPPQTGARKRRPVRLRGWQCASDCSQTHRITGACRIRSPRGADRESPRRLSPLMTPPSDKRSRYAA